MAYEWNWNRKSGEFTFNGYTYNFYKGNGFMIIIDEFTNKETGTEQYYVAYTFLDKEHAKECLGLRKGHYDMFEGHVEKIKIFMDTCPNWKDIVELFTKTQPEIMIEIYPTERKEVA